MTTKHNYTIEQIQEKLLEWASEKKHTQLKQEYPKQEPKSYDDLYEEAVSVFGRES